MNAEKAIKTYRQIKDGKLFGEDLEAFLDSLKFLSDNSEYAEEELYGWEKTVQVNLKDARNFYLRTDNPFDEHPKLSINYGDKKSPDTIIISDVDTFTGIICGRAQGFTGSREFRVEGDGTQAGIFFMLLRLIGQEFTEQKRQGLR
ncbi:hypothetical protein LCGC14_1100780 [marine sediment metagenome]|uniref:SCP2 domain-containing protein n=1 Tax=marine sediment metagenome TaxID=412755 RepID=A0A0F9PSQ4_9ZZZZ|nr:MAG: hypothetical protein Lokiarch_34500 [Candidatus Lokiarchaeum sp. GC14_75]